MKKVRRKTLLNDSETPWAPEVLAILLRNAA